MKTNDLKKGTEVILKNGFNAILEDNKKGNIRMATVFGLQTETGSIYSYNIAEYYDPITKEYLSDIELTEGQKKAMHFSKTFGV